MNGYIFSQATDSARWHIKPENGMYALCGVMPTENIECSLNDWLHAAICCESCRGFYEFIAEELKATGEYPEVGR